MRKGRKRNASLQKRSQILLVQYFFLGFVLFIAFLGYGFEAMHPSVNVDTLAAELYNGSGQLMLRAGRFGMTFWSRFFNYNGNVIDNASSISIVSVAMFFWATVNFCIVLRRTFKDEVSMPAFTVFASCFISYPLMTEIWEYQGANICICGGFLFVSFTLLLIQQQLEQHNINWMSWAGIAFFMTIVCSGYESVVVVYIFMVFAVLLLQEYRDPNWKKHLLEGVVYVIPLVLGLVFRIIVHKLLLTVLHLSPGDNGATEILWGTTDSVWDTVMHLFTTVLTDHILAAIIYTPLLVALGCAGILGIAMLCLFFRKRIFASLLVLGMLVSLEALSILQGEASPYRTCQVFAILVAFVALMLIKMVHPRLRNVVIGGLCLLCILQAISLNTYATLNYRRSQEELAVVDKIGTQLYANYDRTKPVVFIGNYQISDSIMNNLWVSRTFQGRIHQKVCNWIAGFTPELAEEAQTFIYTSWQPEIKFPVTNVNPVLSWSATAFWSDPAMMDNLFAYCNYNLTFDYENALENYRFARDYAGEMKLPGYPNAGYITELEDMIIVNLG